MRVYVCVYVCVCVYVSACQTAPQSPTMGFQIPHPSGIGLQCKFRQKKIAPDGLERFGKDLGRIWETHS